jgi:hypothetical protein
MPKYRPENTRAWGDLQQAESITEICEAVKRNYHEILLATHWKSQEFAICGSMLNLISIDNVYIDKGGNTGNSHYAPRGKKTNWGGRDEFYPRGFPGFSGNLKFQIANMTYDRGLADFDLGRALHAFGIHCGTGGGRGPASNTIRDLAGYQYHVQIFFEDFPALNRKVQEYQQVIKKEQFKAKLANKRCTKSLIDMII